MLTAIAIAAAIATDSRPCLLRAVEAAFGIASPLPVETAVAP